MKCFVQKDRVLISLKGSDRYKLLQGLITNDIYKLREAGFLYAALLTPQGRYLHDFFVFEDEEGIKLDVKAERSEDLVNRLRLYKLRSDVDIIFEPKDVTCVFEVNDLEALRREMQSKVQHVFKDPRCDTMGLRIYGIETLDMPRATEEQFEEYRITLGIPETGKELLVEKSIILECGLDDLHAIDWQKGCYLGQELNARTKHRGMLHKRFLPVDVIGALPNYLDQIFLEDQKVGTIYSLAGSKGIAKIRLEALDRIGPEKELICAGSTLKPYIPDWIKL